MGELFTITDGTSNHKLGFWKLPGGFDRVLAEWSSDGPVARSTRRAVGRR
jgi:hypothetical protein